MKLHDQKGLALVEFALLLPLLLLILFGITEFARAYYLKTILLDSARDGARFASTRPTSVAANDAAVAAYVLAIIPSSAKTGLTVANTAASLHGQDTVKVTLTLPFQSNVPGLDIIDNIPLTGEATMLYQ